MSEETSMRSEQVAASENNPGEMPRQSGAAAWLAANRRTAIMAGSILVVVIVALVLFATSGSNSKSSGTTAPAQNAVPSRVSPPLTADQLRAEVAKYPNIKVYWAGPVEGFTYILTTRSGQTIVGYLPQGQDPVAVNANLQVGSYPVSNAYDVTRQAGDGANSVTENNADGSAINYNKERPTNVYIAFPKVNVQVELFDPNPGMALQWAKSGKIQPVG